MSEIVGGLVLASGLEAGRWSGRIARILAASAGYLLLFRSEQHCAPFELFQFACKAERKYLAVSGDNAFTTTAITSASAETSKR